MIFLQILEMLIITKMFFVKSRIEQISFDYNCIVKCYTKVIKI